MIELQHVTKTYRAREGTVHAIQDFSLTVEPGEIVWLAGRSGSGKSTALNIAGLLTSVTAGRVLFDGRDVTSLPDREASRLRSEEIGFVFQDRNLFPYLTASENVSLGMLSPNDESAARARQLLERIGLGERAAARAGTLSGGEQQRVAVCRAQAKRPRIVLADEPISSLDADAAARVLDDLAAAADQGVAIVIASHDTSVERIAHRRVAVAEVSGA